MTEKVAVTSGEDPGVRVLTLTDPQRRNAIGPQLRDELAAAVAAVAADPDARALVVTGAGSAFCAGADLPAVFGDPDRPESQIRADLQTLYRSFLSVAELSIPTIAAVQGPAVGAGLNLAMCCDIRLAGPQARFAATFTRLGLHPGGGCSYFLVRALGPQQALALLLDGGTLTAAQAAERGMVLAVEPDPVAAATALAARYAALDSELVRDLKRSVQLADRAGSRRHWSSSPGRRRPPPPNRRSARRWPGWPGTGRTTPEADIRFRTPLRPAYR